MGPRHLNGQAQKPVRIVVTDIPHHGSHHVLIVGDFPGFHILTEQIA
jgi:hypothetical protein